jgi:8-oxo-dGTP diphosphatase
VSTPVPAAGVVCLRGDEVLLVRRAKPPRMNDWSLPGGRIEWGERAVDAALRELREETGVEADLLGLIDVIDFLAEERHFVLVDFAATWRSGEPIAGDDAAEARFWRRDEALALVGWPETARVIREAIDRFGGAVR